MRYETTTSATRNDTERTPGSAGYACAQIDLGGETLRVWRGATSLGSADAV